MPRNQYMPDYTFNIYLRFKLKALVDPQASSCGRASFYFSECITVRQLQASGS